MSVAPPCRWEPEGANCKLVCACVCVCVCNQYACVVVCGVLVPDCCRVCMVRMCICLLQMVWIFVFLATVLLGVDLGLLAGVIFSLTTVLIQIIL